jgi:mannosyltransferase
MRRNFFDVPRTFILCSVLILAFGLRTVGIGAEGLWRDEVDAIRFAFEPLPQLLSRFTEPGFNGPLYHLVLRGWLNLVGIHDFGLRYLSVVFGVLLVAVVFVIARRMGGGGTHAAVFAAVSPILIWYAAEGKMYSMQPFVLVTALYALQRATASLRAWGWWSLFAGATVASFGLHVLSPLFLAVAVVAVVCGVRRWSGRALLAVGIVALALVPFVPLVAGRVDQFLAGGDLGHTRYLLGTIVQTLMANWVFGLDAEVPFAAGAPELLVDVVRWTVVITVFGLAAWGALTPQRRRVALVGLAWLVLPALLLYVVSLRVPLFQPRYVLWSAPALYVFADMGLRRLVQSGAARRSVFAAGAVVALVIVTGIIGQRVRPIRPEVREGMAIMAADLQPGDGVVFQIPYMVHSFDYYLRSEPAAKYVTAIDGVYTNAGMSEAEAGLQLEGIAELYPRVWIFESEVVMWDERGLTREWFDANARLLRRDELRGVTVSLYEMAP